jgi:zinc D-Ala-D-Ala dipeptidase
MKRAVLGFILSIGSVMAAPHKDFLSISELCPEIKISASYATLENFTGAIVHGYKAQRAYMAKTPAEALCRVQQKAVSLGMTLHIFDSYRPTKAVAFFQAWAKLPETNPEVKAIYYPKYTRMDLFEMGYIAKQSSHSRGSAVDLTLHSLKEKKDLDMGSPFDYFDDISHTASERVTLEQRKNRDLLKELMEGEGFKNFAQEWWHYSFRPEPFPDQYFDFDVE